MRFSLLALTAVLALSGCGGEPEPIDDGSYSSLQAGAPAALASAGVEFIAPTLPPGVDLDAVEAALAEAGLSNSTQGTREDGDGLAFEPTEVAGLLGSVGNQATAKPGKQRYVVLLFDDPASAVVWAEGSPSIFEDRESADVAGGYLAGSVVGYYAPADGVDETASFAEALGSLAGGSTETSVTPSAVTPS